MVSEEQQAADRRGWAEGGDDLTIDCPAQSCARPAGRGCVDDYGPFGRVERPAPHPARSMRLQTDRLLFLHAAFLAGRAQDRPCCASHRPGPLGCCDPVDCAPCCQHCPTCPTAAQDRPRTRSVTV